MNLYLRYFDNEVLVTTLDEVFDFLSAIPEVQLDDFLISDICHYVESSVMYPKRYKVRGRNYFIIIKTNAATMEEFKAGGTPPPPSETVITERQILKEKLDIYSTYNPGWYESSLVFKRVVLIPGTQKFQYVDTVFAARVKATSMKDCYNRIIDHLRSRQDVDPRSQFPSIKGRNFECLFLGMNP